MTDLLLNRRLVLEAPERQSDGAGGFRENWVALGELWADVKVRSGRETAQASVSVSRVSYHISVRAAPIGNPARPMPQQRFREGTRVFTIQTVAERDPHGRYLTCLVREEAVV